MRWTDEYLKELCERHLLKHSGAPTTIAVGDVMLIKEDERNRGKWKMGIVYELIVGRAPGRDGVVRAAKLRAGNSYLERALQQLYPLELACDRDTGRSRSQLNPDAEAFTPQEARDRIAAVAADAEKEFERSPC